MEAGGVDDLLGAILDGVALALAVIGPLAGEDDLGGLAEEVVGGEGGDVGGEGDVRPRPGLASCGGFAESCAGGGVDETAVVLGAVGDGLGPVARGEAFDVAGVPAVLDIEQLEELGVLLRQPHDVRVRERHGDSLRGSSEEGGTASLTRGSYARDAPGASSTKPNL